MIWPLSITSLQDQKVDANNGGHLLEGQGGVGVIELQSCKIAAMAVAGICVLTIKWLSCQGVPFVEAPSCGYPRKKRKKHEKLRRE